jgi:hypothetical protein
MGRRSLAPGFEVFNHAVFGLLLVPFFLGITHRFTPREP